MASNKRPQMTEDDVLQLLQLFEQHGIDIWVDGGWGVDALLSKQTRLHADLDLAVPLNRMDDILKIMKDLGYQTFEDEMPTRLDMRNQDDKRVDFHPLTFDEYGNGLQQLQDGRFGTYTVEGLSGKGKIGGRTVKCLSPSIQIRFHLGYDPGDDDRHDVLALCRKFSLEIPEAYRK